MDEIGMGVGGKGGEGGVRGEGVGVGGRRVRRGRWEGMREGGDGGGDGRRGEGGGRRAAKVRLSKLGSRDYLDDCNGDMYW